MKPAYFYPCFISYLYNPDPIMHWYDHFTSWPKLVKSIDRLMTWNKRRIWDDDDDEFIFDDKIQFGNRKSCVGGWSVKVNMTYFQQSSHFAKFCW